MQGTLQLAKSLALPSCGNDLMASLAWQKAEALLGEFLRMIRLVYLYILCGRESP